MTPEQRTRDERYLRRAIALARQSREAGRHPFGALIVADDGQVLAESESRKGTGDPTRHSEIEAVRAACSRHPRDVLRRSTIYTSTEPCAMCAGAIYWGALGRVVYGLPEHRLLALTGDHPENPTLRLPCRDVFARGQLHIEVVGPLLEDEAAAVHAGFWEPVRTG